MSKKRLSVFVKLFFLVLTGFLSCVTPPPVETVPESDVIIVDRDGRGQFMTIQEAVDAALMGQVIRIRGGTYAEAVTIATPSLTLEAFDPVNEPVVLEGADRAFLERPPVWNPAGDNVYSTDYQWPFDPPSDAEYSNPESGKYVFRVYEDETLLRGYRNPFDAGRLKNKRIVRFPSGRFGLAGAYASPEELTGPPAPSVPGRAYYDRAASAVVLSPASSDPGSHRYAIPVLPHLVSIKADKTVIRGLRFEHALDYAVDIEGADGTVVDGCLFQNCHFAVRARGALSAVVRNNVVIERGFRERYAGGDAAGTLYERSAVALSSGGASGNFVIENNVMRGTPFFLEPRGDALTVSDNTVAYSIFGLFPPRSLDPSGAPVLSGRVELRGNVMHHLDGGLSFPGRTAPSFEMYVFRNAFYLAESAGPISGEGTTLGRGFRVYHNVFAIAGTATQAPLAGWMGESRETFNNIFYAADVDYHVFAATGTGNPYPVVGGPFLGYNLFLSPLGEAAGVGTVRIKDEPFLFARIGESAAAGSALQSPCFALGRPLADPAFFNEQFDPPVPIEAAAVFRDGAAAFCRAFRERLVDPFRLDEKSPARGIGRPLPADLPGAGAPGSGNPDVGIGE